MDIEVFTPYMQTRVTRFFERCFSSVGISYSPADRHADVADIERYYMRTGCFWCLISGGEIIGTVAVRRIDDSADTVELKRLFVLPECQGNGYGRRLLRHAEAYARAQRYKKMCLDTRRQFSAAQQLYISEGFEAIERYNDNPTAELYFELTL